MKIKSLFFLIPLFFWMAPAQAYPWMFFRELNSSEIFKLDSHASYFLKGESSFFSGFSLNYHNPMADVNLGYTYSYLEKKSYFRLSELSVTFPFVSEDWNMHIGFKSILWSEADQYWNYGLWQARYLLDPLRPVQVGTPGIHFDYKKNNVSFLLSLSYFYLPDIVIVPELSNEKVFSKNPFFISKVNIDVKNLDLSFRLKKFLKPSLSFQIKHNLDPFHFNFSYAYKGMNQIQTTFNMQGIDLSKADESKIQLKDFTYKTHSHHLASVETEARLFEKGSLFLSFFYENPEKSKENDGRISSHFSPLFALSVLAYFQEEWSEERKTLFTIGYTKVTEHDSQAKTNPIIESFTEDIDRNMDWKSAISASVEHENKSFYEGALFRFRANYALDNNFYQLTAENYIYVNSNFRTYLSGDLFFRFSDEPIRKKTSAIKKYKGFNRILIGTQYVF